MLPASTVNLNGLVVRYSVEGCGPDVLLVHGWGSSRQMWRRLAAALAPRYRCWSLDLPGFGDSDKPDGGWHSIPNHTLTLRRFAEVMGLTRARVIGHSMGGMIALDYAAAYPAAVERLVVINPVVTGRAHLRVFAQWEWERSAELLDHTLRLSRHLIQPFLQPVATALLPVGLHSYQRRAAEMTQTTAETLLGAGRAVTGYDVFPHLARITAPTLVLLGLLDTNVPNSEGHLAAVEIPDARLVVFAAGHLVTDDHPAETQALIREFLA